MNNLMYIKVVFPASKIFTGNLNTADKIDQSMFRFQKSYALVALFLFIAEVIIALFIRDRFIRPYGGDFLVVIFIYCFLKSFWNAPVLQLAAGVLVFSYLIEISQYLNLIDHLGLRHARLAILILGKSFQWFDLLAYTLGIGLVICVERMRNRK